MFVFILSSHVQKLKKMSKALSKADEKSAAHDHAGALASLKGALGIETEHVFYVKLFHRRICAEHIKVGSEIL